MTRSCCVCRAPETPRSFAAVRIASAPAEPEPAMLAELGTSAAPRRELDDCGALQRPFAALVLKG